MNHTCPQCKGQRQIKNPDGSLWQQCPYCLGSGEDPGFEDSYFAYKATIVLTANQLLASQKVSMNGISDFRLKLLTRKATSTFRLRLDNAAGRHLSQADPSATTNDRIPDSCLFGDGALPFVIAPHPIYPKNGFIAFDIEDTSGAGNTVELVFHGALMSWG